MYVKKDDMVIVLTGKDKGKKGKILRVFRDLDKVTVEGVAVRKKTMKAKSKGRKGQVIEMAAPIHVSNPAFGICALAAESAAKHMDRIRMIRDFFFMVPPSIDDKKLIIV